jgi:hypothetical protein
MTMLQQIADALSIFQIYEKLFQSHEPLQQKLSSMYLELISFLSGAKKVFCSSSFKSFKRGVGMTFCKTTFHTHISELRRYINLIEKDGNLAHMIAASQERRESAEWRSLNAKLIPNGKQSRCH